MKNIIDYEIKFINNKPIIYIKYDDNSFDVLKLTTDIYREVVDEMEVNVSEMTREKILYTERKKLTKSGLISLGIVFSSPYAFALTYINDKIKTKEKEELNLRKKLNN